MNKLYQQWLQIPADRLPPNHYALLGLDDFESDSPTIEQAAKKRAAYLHSIAAGPQRKAVQELLGKVAAARRTLMDQESKDSYDQSLRTPASPATPVGKPAAETSSVASTTTEPISASIASESYAASRRKRKQFQWKFHAISASVLLLIVGVVYWVNRGGGGRRAAEANPKTAPTSANPPAKPSTSATTPKQVESSGIATPSRPTRTANATTSSNLASTRQASSAAPKKFGSELGRTQGSGLLGGGGLGGGKFDAVLSEINQSSQSDSTSKMPASAGTKKGDAWQLPPGWLTGLKPIDVFPGSVEKRFKLQNSEQLFQAKNGALVLRPSKNDTATQVLTELKPGWGENQAALLIVRLGDDAVDGQVTALGLPNLLVGLRVNGDKLEIVKKASGKDDGFIAMKTIPRTNNPIRLVAIRHSRNNGKLRWVVDGPANDHTGELTAGKVGAKASLAIYINTTKNTPQDSVKLSELKIGKLQDVPQWP